MSNLINRWRSGLAKTSKATFGQISALLGTSEVTDETYEELEALLIKADLGIETSESLLEVIWERERKDGITKTSELNALLKEQLLQKLESPPELDFSANPTVILVVGVNGSGKTTTIAKLGKRYSEQNKSIIFGAADTYRAAAVDQLQIWGERLNIPVIAGQQNGDPGAVAYDTVQASISRNADLAFIDTAGRLHTRFNLMEELKKVHRVVGKALPGAPHHVWLVMDATTGQNALQQAQAFKEAVDVTGIILAKLDSSARGGMAFAIQKELGLPILFAGLGESPEDLQPFDPQLFIEGILVQEELG
jgi:fused signal recognition particle receptor